MAVPRCMCVAGTAGAAVRGAKRPFLRAHMPSVLTSGNHDVSRYHSLMASAAVARQSWPARTRPLQRWTSSAAADLGAGTHTPHIPAAASAGPEILLMSGAELTAMAQNVAATIRAASGGHTMRGAAEAAALRGVLEPGFAAARELLQHAELDAASFHALIAAYRSTGVVDEELLAAVQPMVEQRLPEFTLAQLASFAHVYAGLTVPPSRVIDSIATRAGELLKASSAWELEDVVVLVTACCRARVRPLVLLEAAAEELPRNIGKSAGRGAPAHRLRRQLSLLADALVKSAYVPRKLVDALARATMRCVRDSVAGIIKQESVSVAVRRELVTDVSSLAYNLTLLGAGTTHSSCVHHCIRTAILVGNTTGPMCVRALKQLATWQAARESAAPRGPSLHRAFEALYTTRTGQWSLSPGDHPANITRVYRCLLAAGAAAFDVDHPAAPRHDLLAVIRGLEIVPAELLPILRTAYIRTASRRGASIVSQTQQTVVKRLHALAQAHHWPTPVPEHVTDSGVIVDVALPFHPIEGGPGTQVLQAEWEAARRAGYAGVAFEVDGPCHYMAARPAAGAPWSDEDADNNAQSASELAAELYSPQLRRSKRRAETLMLPDGAATNLNTLLTHSVLRASGWILASITLPEIERFVHAQPNGRVDAFLIEKASAAIRTAIASRGTSVTTGV